MIKKKKIFMVVSMITSIIYIYWRVFYTIPFSYGMISLIAGIALVSSEFIGVIEAFFHYQNISSNNCIEMPKIKNYMYPDVDVFIATHSEDTSLLYKTINGCLSMKYPDKNKVHIYVCDDNNRPEMKELAEFMGVGYLGLSDNKHAKAGNLNNAISKTNSPLIATFDADMIPRSNFLLETVPYFFLPIMEKENEDTWRLKDREDIDRSYKIGFIQTPQSFYNADLFQFNLFAENNIPNEQDFFFREVNVGRNHSNSPIYAGSNTLISRMALEDVGGIRRGTITEDFATGIDIQSKGYSCYAIPKVLAHGLSPSDFKSLVKQRQRWGRGCVQTLLSPKFLFGKLKLKSKLSYITSFLYWWTFIRRLVYIMSPILFTVFGIVVVDASLIELLIIWLPAYIMYNKALKVISGDIRDQKWSNIVDTIIFPYMIIPIIFETLGIKLKKFAVTPKEKMTSRNVHIKYALPHIFLTIATILGLWNSLVQMIKYNAVGNLILVFWLLVNLYFLLMSIVFMLGRVNYRNEERFYAKVNVKVSTEFEDFDCMTSDISEGGLAVILDIPHYVSKDVESELLVTTDDYTSKMKANIVHVRQIGDHWKYSFKISEISEENRREYLKIVFDREHTLPVTIKSHVVKDVLEAIKGKVSNPIISNRKLPRIPVDADAITSEGNNITVLNFNYEYLLVDGISNKKKINIKFDDELVLSCLMISNNIDKNTTLYKVESWESIANNRDLMHRLLSHMGLASGDKGITT